MTVVARALQGPASRVSPGLRSRVWDGALLAAVLVANLALFLALRRGPLYALALGLLPLLAVAFAALLRSDRSVLLFAAFALPMSAPPLTSPLPVPGPVPVYVADFVVAVGVVAWLVDGLFERKEPSRRSPEGDIPGWPFALFSLAILTAVARGYGNSLSFGVSAPLRLVAYAGIGAAVIRVTPAKAYRGIVAVFYAGTVWMLLNAVYYLATGTAQTDQTHLSTGGLRVLSGSVAVNMALTLVLALVNLQVDGSARGRALHLTMAALALLGVILGYTRAVFVALLIVVPFILLRRPILKAFGASLPLIAPFLVLGVLLVGHLQPQILPTFVSRVSASPQKDPNFEWRVKANRTIWGQVEQSPVFGAGFGKPVVVVASDTHGIPRQQLFYAQEAHDDYVWLLAGGGVAALGSFVLLLAVHAWRVRKKLRAATGTYERALLHWAAAGLVVVLVASIASPGLSGGGLVLTLWALLVLPWVVKPRADDGP